MKQIPLLILLATLPIDAQTDLRGIFVGGNSIINENPKSLNAALNVPGVDGFLLNIGWNDIEPSLGQYQWTILDQWLATAMPLGKKITLSVADGDNTPAWLFQPPPTGGGATPLNFSISRKGGASNVCNPETIAAPWDPAFLAQWDAMLAALSAHLKATGAYSSITLLRLTGVNRDTDELHLPAETAQSTGLACVSDAVATWLQAGYRPSLLLQGWNASTDSFMKYFPDKSFTVALIDSGNPFPAIAENGTIIPFVHPADLSPSQNLPLMTAAAQKFPGHLVIQNNSLYPTVPAQPETIQSAQGLGTMLAFQTNEDLPSPTGKIAGCGTSFTNTAPCNAALYLQMLQTGIYPLGKTNPLRAQYIELFATDAVTYSADILQAHFELAPPLISLVANAEGESPTIAPNTWVEIKGAALSFTGDTRVWKSSDFVNNQLPTQLDNISVTVNGKAAYVYYISPSQINILTPPDPMSGPVPVVVTNNGNSTTAFTVQAQPLSPSFFVFNGGPYVAATHVNGALLGPLTLYPGSTTPAKPGEIVALYANGFGLIQTGSLSPTPGVKIGGVSAMVQFAGLVSPGQYQFNVAVPPGLPDGDQPITATYNGQSTQPGTLISVHQ